MKRLIFRSFLALAMISLVSNCGQSDDSRKGNISVPLGHGMVGSGGGSGTGSGAAGGAGTGGVSGAGENSGPGSGGLFNADAGSRGGDGSEDGEGSENSAGLDAVEGRGGGVVMDAGGGEAACMNGEDLDILVETTSGSTNELDSVANGCTIECIGKASDNMEACVLDCVVDGTGLSEACAGCFAIFAQCTLDFCLEQCISDLSTEECMSCRDDKCASSFAVCTGLAGSTEEGE